MKRLVLLFVLVLALAVPAWADVISPGEMLVQSGILPAVLVIAVVGLVEQKLESKKRSKKEDDDKGDR